MLDKIILKGKEVQMSDDEFFNFCQANPELNIERSPQREIIIMPRPGSISGFINNKIAHQLETWNEKNDSGLVFDSSTGFTLPDQSVKSPDASWLSLEKWKQLTPEQQKKFAPVCPEFVVELKSENDRLDDLQAKMESWLQNGAQLGWLIIPDEETVFIYEAGKPVRQHKGFQEKLPVDPVLPGFSLDLSKLSLP
jgi:Uma2 family endonuclease